MASKSKIAGIIQSQYQKLSNDHSEIFNEVEMYENMYHTYIDEEESYPWDYSLCDPMVFQLVRNIQSRLNPSNMSVILEATTKEAVALKEKNEDILNWEMGELNKSLILWNFIYRLLLAGRSYLSTGWHFEPALRVKAEKSDRIMRQIINRATASNVRFTDIFIPNRNIPDLMEQPAIYEHISMRYGDMVNDNTLRQEAGLEPLWDEDKLKEIKDKKIFENKIDYGEDIPETEDEKVEEEGVSEDIFINNQYVSLIKFQTKDGDLLYVPEKEKEWILNNDKVNPYYHGHYNYISTALFPEDNEFFSSSIVQPVADLQIAINSTLNQYLTNGRKASNPMWIKGQGASQTPDWQFVSRPDGVITVAGDPTSIQQVKPVDTSDTMITMRRELISTFERGISMSSVMTTGNSSGAQLNKTATGARIVEQNMDTNIQAIVDILATQVIKNLGEHFMELNMQYVTEEQTFKLTGKKDFVLVKPEEITANFEVIVKPHMMFREAPVVKQAALLNLKSTFAKDPNINMTPLNKSIIRSYPEVEDLDEIILDPKETAQEAIDSIMKGVIPEVSPLDDHKTIIKIVQKHLLEMDHDDDTLMAFATYLDEHRKYIKASNTNLITAIPPQQPLLPTNEADLMQSMEQTVDPTQGNPTTELPVTLTQDQMGMMQ